MEKTERAWAAALIILVLLAIALFYTVGQNVTYRRQFKNIDCENLGYVDVDTVNELVQFTNILIGVVNGYENTTVETLPEFVDARRLP